MTGSSPPCASGLALCLEHPINNNSNNVEPQGCFRHGFDDEQWAGLEQKHRRWKEAIASGGSGAA